MYSTVYPFKCLSHWCFSTRLLNDNLSKDFTIPINRVIFVLIGDYLFFVCGKFKNNRTSS
jgi:hypothetical protein